MSRKDLELFVERWTRTIVEGASFAALLPEGTDPAPFDARAAAARARLGPSFTLEVDDLVAEGDAAAWRWTLRRADGTIATRGVNFQRVVAGRAVEHWTQAVDVPST